jgi:hypothetical protein
MSAPFVNVVEWDLSQRVPGFEGIYGAMVIPARRGRVGEPVLVTSQTDYLKKYTWKERVEVGETSAHFSALAYLEASNKLWVIRVANNPLYGGALISSGQDIDSSGTVDPSKGLDSGVSDPQAFTFPSNDYVLAIFGANPGEWNNKVGIKIYTYDNYPDKVKVPGAFLIEVYEEGDEVNPVETWVCSRDPNAKDGYGRNIYVEEVLKGSNYIQAQDNLAVDKSVKPQDITSILWLKGGDDGNAVTDADIVNALQKFKNPDDIPVTLFMDAGWATPAVQLEMLSIAEQRQDSVAILSTPYSAEESANYLNEIVNYRKVTLNANSSWGAIYTSHVKILDRFNNRELFIDPTGFVGGIISKTAMQFEIWYPPAGWRRGILNVLDVRRRFSRGEMDYLYDNGINPIRFRPGWGIAVWGQKTLQTLPSALDRLNVRLLLIVLEPAIKKALESFVFEFNDEATRLIVRSMLESYLQNIKARGGIYEFYVKCDEENNTPEDIDNYRMNVWVFIQPTKSAEFIKVPIIITRTGANFGEIASALL